MKQSNLANMLNKSLIAGTTFLATAFLVSCGSAKSQKATHAPTPTAPQIAELALVGEWGIAIEPTAEVLARAEFGKKQTVTVKRGATTPITNIVTVPFDQQKFDQSKGMWLAGLHKMKLQEMRILLDADRTGRQLTPLESGQVETNQVKWEIDPGNVLHLELQEGEQVKTNHYRIVSTNEWHYTMKPLGGWFVMRRK